MATTTKIRLLFCETCASVDELPDYSGPVERDDTLNYLVANKHTWPSGTPHVGGHLADVAKTEWDTPSYRTKIIEKMNEAIKNKGSDGLGNTFYETRDTFADDAMSCWKSHNRTTDCSDYRHKSKALIPDTKDLRKEIGLSTRAADMPKTFICDFCPAKSSIEQRKNASAGYYDFKN
jgi:hypothetical protein